MNFDALDEDPRAVRRKTSLRIEQRLQELPVLPAVVLELLKLKQGTDSYFEEVTKLVSSDPGFASKIISYANSAALAPRSPVVRVRDAVLRAGASGTAGLVLSSTASRVFVPRERWARNLWCHALEVAAVAWHVARLVPARAPVDRDEAYLGGLLHDVGRFVLYLEAPEEVRAIAETASESSREAIEAEETLCGYTHPELGYLAAGKWGLPALLNDVIRNHHASAAALAGLPANVASMIDIVQFADWACLVLCRRHPWQSMEPEELREVLAGDRPEAAKLCGDRVATSIRNGLHQAEAAVNALGM